ncbi:MAG: arginine--tRNA ligase [Gammaproteobacteria bacterium]|nr:arginine--tRNA ligase [Gammaproteobacteria bacterium]
MKGRLEETIRRALRELHAGGELAVPPDQPVQVERCRDGQHGDFATNVAMAAAKACGRRPRELAELIATRLPADDLIERVEVAGPGFINFFLRRNAFLQVIAEIHRQGSRYGTSRAGRGERILLEFVSANPTGPLHIGHGRGAAYGAALANLLTAAGHEVSREYYVNDSGRQMDILALSIWLRYLEIRGHRIELPPQAYRGEYIRDIAAKLNREAGSALEAAPGGLLSDLPPGGDDDARLDEVVTRSKKRLGPAAFDRVLRLGVSEILSDIRDDLAEFGVSFDTWFSERSLVEEGRVDACIARLKASGDLYEKDGAWWLRSSEYGDEKDRVVIRENGQTTYLASDIAYHLNKFERGFDRAIDIWGADHHGYISRVKAALAALGRDPDMFNALLVQFATLYRGRERVQMSTRSGEFITLRELRREVGNDAARFFYVTRKSEQHLDFDLELAKAQSQDNPVYYVQYAHARICSVLRQMVDKGYEYDPEQGLRHLLLLEQPHEISILNSLSRYPEIIVNAAHSYDPHLIAFFLRELANEFHAYYNTHQFLVEQATLRNARLSLVLAVRQLIRNGLGILGVSAPESM